MNTKQDMGSLKPEELVVHRVPENLDLAFLHRAELVLVGLGMYQVHFHFHPAGVISVEGGWEMLSSDGTQSDDHARHTGTERPPYQLHRLLGLRVIGSKVSAPDWFALTFETGWVLRVFDNSEQYESFSIQPGNIFV
jgi:hypothetical protein